MELGLESLVGHWVMVARATVNGEIAFVGDEPDASGVSNWLNASGEELEASLSAAVGTSVQIEPDGRFAESPTSELKGNWFDVEGVLTDGSQAMDVKLEIAGETAWLQPTGIPKWSKHGLNRYGPAALRYDDGDTKISDALRLKEGRLLRTVNVVTDELYTDRQLIAYQRQGL